MRAIYSFDLSLPRLAQITAIGNAGVVSIELGQEVSLIEEGRVGLMDPGRGEPIRIIGKDGEGYAVVSDRIVNTVVQAEEHPNAIRLDRVDLVVIGNAGYNQVAVGIIVKNTDERSDAG
jgi:hypothetical protein